MKLEVGQFVRTKEGYIAKCTYINEELEGVYDFDSTIRKRFGDKYDFIYCKEQEEHIIKASNNIIDLIEEGDYVNGYKVVSIKNNRIGLGISGKSTAYYYFGEEGLDLKIETIVTREQFSAMEYKLGD